MFLANNKIKCFVLGHEWEATIRKDIYGGTFKVCTRCDKIDDYRIN